MAEQQSTETPPPDAATEPPAPETGAGEHTAPPESLFTEAERAQFDAEDVAAGSHIGKMLALFFLYTVAAMSIVAWWTFRSVE